MPELDDAAVGDLPVIPGLALLRRIGRGSYGDVWLAQEANGDFRAVKIVYRKTFERDRPFEREFSGIQKFQPVSHAEPSQVSILQVGRDDEAGFFYYVMELADDEVSGRQIDPAVYKPKTLRSEVSRAGRIPYLQALDISLSLTKALEHLHRHGLIHRDIKPSNIIFVNGVAKLADIGLVTDVGASISYVGTEGFLPPEGPVSPQADIYSLGKVLYEMSTGQDRLDFPELPTFLGDAAEKQGLLELNLVFLKACQNDPLKRYRSAHDMYADLTLLRGGKSLKRARALEKRLATATRASIATAAIGLLVATGLYLFNQHRLNKLQAEITRQRHDARLVENTAKETRERLIKLFVAHGEQSLRAGDAGGALAWHARALYEEVEPSGVAAHQSRMARLLKSFPKLAGFLAHTGGIHSAYFSHDNARVITAGEDQTARIWDIASGQLATKPLRHKSAVVDARLNADQQRVLSICQDGTAWLWRLAPDETIALELSHGAAARAGEFSPNGRLALTRGENTSIVVWDGLNARERFRLRHEAVPADARFSADGRYIGVVAGPTLRVWDTERGDHVSEARSAHGEVTQIAFGSENRRAVVVAGGVAQVCNIASGEWAIFTIRETARITSAQFLPDGSIITATESGAVHLWDSVTGDRIKELWTFRDRVNVVPISPDGAVGLCVANHSAYVIDLKSNYAVIPPVLCQGRGQRAAFSSDARLLLTAGGSGAVWITAMPTGTTNDVCTFAALARDELMSASRVLSGREVDEGERLVEVQPARLRADWERLRTNAAFRLMAPAAWHRARAERLFGDGMWFGVRFHAERLAKLNVADDQVRSWDQQASIELARAASHHGSSLVATPSTPTPARSPDATPNLIDLTRYYNASLAQTWLPTNYVGRSNDLAQLPVGVQKLNGVAFEIRGLIQLSGSALENFGARFPQRVANIPVQRKCRKLHFLQGAAWEALYGTVIGKYVVTYADGERREIKIVFGKNVREWWFPPTQPQITMEAAVAWQGTNPASRNMGMALRIYQFQWENPRPDTEVHTIDFVSSMEKPAPFLLAITAED
ncbi:MAG: serine/threonine-protein kinase [Verrucomicrobia subdivision 3 bacterium]|nr:serine/threonine-protein kinase [Limisphaerales bacterium]